MWDIHIHNLEIVWHAIVQDKIFRPLTSSRAGKDVCRTSNAEVDADNLLRLYLREITTQVLLYIGAFLLCYVPVFIRYMKISSTFVNFLAVTFYPLNGLFTILIYTRPGVGHLRRGYPEYSWASAFILVLKPGGVENTAEHKRNLEQVNHSSPCRSLPFGVANSCVVSSGVEFAGSERISDSSCCEYNSSVIHRSTDDHDIMEGCLKQGQGLILPVNETLPSSPPIDDILAKAMARTLKMGKK